MSKYVSEREKRVKEWAPYARAAGIKTANDYEREEDEAYERELEEYYNRRKAGAPAPASPRSYRAVTPAPSTASPVIPMEESSPAEMYRARRYSNKYVPAEKTVQRTSPKTVTEEEYRKSNPAGAFQGIQEVKPNTKPSVKTQLDDRIESQNRAAKYMKENNIKSVVPTEDEKWHNTYEALSPEEKALLLEVYTGQYDTSSQAVQGGLKARNELKDKYKLTDDEITILSKFASRKFNEGTAKQMQGVEDFADKHPVISSIASVPANLAGGYMSALGGLRGAIDTAQARKAGYGGRELNTIDINDPLFSATRTANTIRDTTTKDMSRGGSFVYQTAMSGLDSLAAAISPVGAATIGLSAGADTMIDLADRGASTSQALAGGIVSGVFESLFESVSISNLRSFSNLEKVSVRTVKDALKKAAGSTITNASEEGLTEIANIIYDTLANGDISDYARAMNEYMANGYSEEEAKKLVARDMALRVGEAAAGGALMGAAFGIGGSAFNAVATRRNDRYNTAAISVYGAQQDTLENANIVGGDAQAYKDARIKERGGEEKLTPEDYGMIATETQKTLQEDKDAAEEFTKAIDERIKNRERELEKALEKNGGIEDENLHKAFIDSYSGGDVNKYTKNFIAAAELAATGGVSTKPELEADLFERGMLEGLSNAAVEAAFKYGRDVTKGRPGAHVFAELKGIEESKRRGIVSQIGLIDQFGKRNGLSFSFVDNIREKNAFYKNSTGSNQIVISIKADGGLLTRTAGHETFHWMEQYDRENGTNYTQDLKDFIMGYYTETKGEEWINSFFDKWYQGYGDENAKISEFAADHMFDALTSERVVNDLIQNSPDFASKIRKHIGEAIQFFRNAIAKLKERWSGEKNSYMFEEIREMESNLDVLNEINNRFADALERIRGDEVTREQVTLDSLISDRKAQQISQLTDALNSRVEEMTEAERKAEEERRAAEEANRKAQEDNDLTYEQQKTHDFLVSVINSDAYKNRNIYEKDGKNGRREYKEFLAKMHDDYLTRDWFFAERFADAKLLTQNGDKTHLEYTRNALKEAIAGCRTLTELKALESVINDLTSWSRSEALNRRSAYGYDEINEAATKIKGYFTRARNAMLKDTKANSANTQGRDRTFRGVYDTKKIQALFNELNGDKELTTLANKVFSVCDKFGVRYKGDSNYNDSTGGVSAGLRVRYNNKYFGDPSVTDQEKAEVIVHEAIHSVTSYYLDGTVTKNSDGNYVLEYKNRYGSTISKHPITKEVADSIQALNDIYKDVTKYAKQPDTDINMWNSGNGDYGTKSVNEFVAELSNTAFREKLKKAGFWQKIKDVIKGLLGINAKNSYDAAGKALDTLLDNYDTSIANKYDMYRPNTKTWTFSSSRDAQIQQLNDNGIEVADDNSVVFSSIRAFGQLNEQGEFEYDKEKIRQIAKTMSAATGIPESKCKKYLEDNLSLTALVLRDREHLEYEADDFYSAFKSNSEYWWGAVDFNTNCPKRKSFTDIYDRLQEAFPNRAFDMYDLAVIRNILQDSGIKVACGLCFVEDRRQQLGKIASEYISMVKESQATGKTLAKKNAKGEGKDLHVTAKLAKQWGDILDVKWKDDIVITDKYVPTQYDLGTYEGFRELREKHPQIAMGYIAFNNSRGQQSGRLIEGNAEYKRQLRDLTPDQVETINNHGGLRIFSFSDFEAPHTIDLIQIIEDCAEMGIKIQAYTKQPAFARMVQDTNLKLNLSRIPRGLGYQEVAKGTPKAIERNGKYYVLLYDNKEGIDKSVDDYIDTNKNDSIGNVLVGINDMQIRLAMKSKLIDFIIPFHTNQTRAVLAVKGVSKKWDNYRKVQNEKIKSTGKNAKENVNIYTDVIQKYGVSNEAAKAQGITAERMFTEAFLRECAEHKDENGKPQPLTPRFAQFLDKGNIGGYGYTEGYYKFLVDYKLFNQKGEMLEQKVVVPKFDIEYVQQMIEAQRDSSNEFETEKPKRDAAVNTIGALIRSGMLDQNGALRKEVQNAAKNKKNDEIPSVLDLARQKSIIASAKRDMQYFEALDKYGEDSQEVSDIVEKTLEDAGYNSPKLWHGTKNFGFTSFDLSKMEDRRSIFLAADPDISGTYSGVQGTRKISDNKQADVSKLHGKELVEAANKALENSIMNEGDYRYVSNEDLVNASIDADEAYAGLVNALNDAIKQVRETTVSDGFVFPWRESRDIKVKSIEDIRDAVKKWYKDDGGPVDLKRIMEDFHIGAPWMDAKISNEIRNSVQDATNRARQGRLAYMAIKETIKNKEYLVRESYAGNLFPTTEEHIKERVSMARPQGNYAMKANLGKTLEVDAKNNFWNDIPFILPNAELPDKKYLDYDIHYSYKGDQRGLYIDLIDSRDNKTYFSYPISEVGLSENIDPLEFEYNTEILEKLYEMSVGKPITNEEAADIWDTRELAQWAKENGYDSVTLKNVYDDGGQGDYEAPLGDIYIIFDPNAVKSLDPVTYDDDGNIIPPSQRANPNESDFRYSEKREYAESFNELYTFKDGKLIPKNVADLSTEDWQIIRKAVNKLGYGIKSAKEAKEVYSRYVGENGFNPEQSAEIAKAYGVNSGESETKENPARMLRAEKYYGTTTDFAEAGYLLRDGKMLDFSGAKFGGTRHMRSIDHREINAMFDTSDSEPYDSNTRYMNAFISEGQIRLMDGVGITIGEIEPSEKQYKLLERFIERTLDSDNYFAVDIINPKGNNIENREYDGWDSSSKIISDIKYYYKNGEMPYRSELSDFRYSTKRVPEIQPTSNGWQRTATYAEVKERYPNLWDVTADESEKRNPTQVSGTVKTYNKIYERLKSEGFKGTILDASSGLGYGTRSGRDNYGFKVDDIEPFPDAEYNPKYKDYSELEDSGKQYDAIISNAVLNVIPQDERDNLVVAMGHLLKPGGRMFINVRGDDVKNASSKAPINPDLNEWYISSSGSYQKGFTKPELKAYLEDALGPDYTVETANWFGLVSAVVTKDKNADNTYSEMRTLEDDFVSNASEEELADLEAEVDSRMVDQDNEVVSLNNQITELTAERDRLLENEAANKNEITKLNNRIEILEGKLERRKKQVQSLQGKLKRRDAKIEGLSENYAEARARERSALVKQRAMERQQLTAERHKQIGRIQKITSDISRKLRENTEKNKVLEPLKPSVSEFVKLMTDLDTFDAKKTLSLVNALNTLNNTIKNSDEDSEITTFYDEAIAQRITDLTNHISAYAEHAFDEANRRDYKYRTINLFNVEALKDIKDVARYIQHIVNASNKAFSQGISESISDMGETATADIETKKPTNIFRTKLQTAMMKPVTFFDMLGDKTLSGLYDNIRDGENKWAKVVDDARKFRMETQKNHNYDSWKDDQVNLNLNGKTVKLDMEDALSLYATIKRSNRQGIEHLIRGGFSLDSQLSMSSKDKLKVATKEGRQNVVNSLREQARKNKMRITEGEIAQFVSQLTDEQKAYADEMVEYMSNDMARLGNDVSMKLYGIRKFNENYYYPITSDPHAIYENASANGTDDNRIKHMSMTKPTMVRANNPLIIAGFTNTVMRHCSDMGLYYGLALPMEDFTRVYNYKGMMPTEEMSGEQINLRDAIQNVYSENANDYIVNLLRDINGRGGRDAGEQMTAKFVSMFKKNAVFASMSVAIQQPSAIMRAARYIDLKYLAETTVKKRDYEELKKWAPVAIVKEMGYFDTGVGRTAVDWMNSTEYKGFKEKAKALVTDSAYRDEALSWLPSKMDEVTWAHLWNAVKAETKAKTGLKEGTDEFYETAAKRFTYIVDRTQVYDSVFSRSQWMRSKGIASQMATAFMAEPTTSLNMLYNGAFGKLEDGETRKNAVAKSAMAFVGAVALNNALKAIVTSARHAKPDEEKSLLEMYVNEFLSGSADDLNLFNYIPYLRDFISILKGYDSTRMDTQAFTLVADAINKWEKNGLTSDTIKAIANSLGMFLGIPVSNILKDINGATNIFRRMLNTIKGEGQKTTATGMKYAVRDAVYQPDTKKQYTKLVDSYVKGDTKKVDKIEEDLVEHSNKGNLSQTYLADSVKKKLLAGKMSKEQAIDILVNLYGYKDGGTAKTSPRAKATNKINEWLEEQ